MLAVIARPWDSTLEESFGVPPAPFGVGGFGPSRTFTPFTGALVSVVFADDTYKGDPGDTGIASDRSVSLQAPPAPFGVSGFGPARTLATAIWPASSLPSSHDVANLYFAPRLKQSFNYEHKLFSGDEPSGRGAAGSGEMTVINTDGGLDYALAYGWDGRTIEVFEGEKTEPFYPGFSRRFVGTVESLEWDTALVYIRLRDPELRCRHRVQQSVYDGTGGIEGDSDLAGRLRPEAFGYCENVACVLINSASLIYQVHSRQIQAVNAVRDKGASVTDSGSDYATYALLAAASVTAGQFATCLAYGLVRLGSAPAGQVTADIEGDAGASGVGGEYVNDIGGIIRRIATTFLPSDERFVDPDEIESDRFAAFYAQQSSEVGYFCDRGEIAADAFDQLMASAGGAWYVTLLGQLAVRRLEAPSGTPAVTIKEFQIATPPRRRGTTPSWRRRLGYRKIWHVQSKDDLAGSVTETNRALYSQEYRWSLATDENVRDINLRARDVELPGFFRNAAAAETEVLRQQELFGVLRHIYTVRVKGINYFARNLGDALDVSGWTRFSWSDPESFILIGIQANIARGELVYDLWH